MRGDERPGHVPEESPVLQSDLVDLRGIRLDQLEALPANVLASSLRRILLESARQPHSYGQDYAASI